MDETIRQRMAAMMLVFVGILYNKVRYFGGSPPYADAKAAIKH